MKTSIGKNTLGGGKKMTVEMKNYNRSTHDLSRIMRTTMSVGTLVPTYNELLLPGDTFPISTRAHVLTHPTVGPLFGSFKMQNDFFFCPIRLYNAMLHNNTLGVGLNMSKVKLPKCVVQKTWQNKWLEGSNQTILKEVNPSSILYYLGEKRISTKNQQEQSFCALKLLSYFDIFKNYYANKQEDNFYIIQGGVKIDYNGTSWNEPTSYKIGVIRLSGDSWVLGSLSTNEKDDEIIINTSNGYAGLMITGYNQLQKSDFLLKLNITLKKESGTTVTYNAEKSIEEWEADGTLIQVSSPNPNSILYEINRSAGTESNPNSLRINEPTTLKSAGANIKSYPLSVIDEMRENILKEWDTPYIATNEPFINDLFDPITDEDGDLVCKMAFPQNGLLLKTYQSDINTNWIKTEWIDGDNGINAITAIDTSSGSFTLDTLNLAKKVYDMLNRIAISDGTYNAWIQTVYTSGGLNHIETPLYIGGSSLEIEFQEVINQAGTEEEPLGSLAGRGVATNHKGSEIRFKADEPGYIICISSITPRVDYFQGNKWDMELETMDDLHKPQLDGIGFQDRLYKQLNASARVVDLDKTIGKQPAWVEYTTAINETAGNFAIQQNEGWMCLNRIFGEIETYTTYVFPYLYNNIFADTDISAQNFWVQIYFENKPRRVMSAKQMPNV